MKTKRIISVFLAIVMCLGMVFVADAETQPLDGYTPVYTAEDLNNIRNNLDGKYILMNDIDLSVYENWEPIGTSDAPFTGEFDGDGYQIKNLTIEDNPTEDSKHYYGLFGYAMNSNIKNITIVDCEISVHHQGENRGDACVGAIVAYCGHTTISDCTVFGELVTDGFAEGCIGGIAGRCKYAEISRCANYADVEVINYKYSSYVSEGGIIGDLLNASVVSECSNQGEISAVGEAVKDYCRIEIGGISGNCDDMWAMNNYVINSYNAGKVSTSLSDDEIYIGGICGESYDTDCIYNIGEISVPEGFEGFAGAISGNISHSMLAIGMPHYMKNAYHINANMIPSYDWESIPESFDEYPFVNVKLLSEEEFKNQESFVGFDFENVWEMEENGYPVLKNQPEVTVKEKIELEVGQRYLITPGYYHHTTDQNVAKTDIEGRIVAIGEGTAVITIRYSDKYIKEITVNVHGVSESVNNVESAEIVYVPLKNRLVFSAGSPNLPDGIVLKLKYKDGSEKTETVTYNIKEDCYRAGEETVIGSVRVDVVEYGLLTDTLYINDSTVSVEYDYFVPPTLSYIFMQVINLFLNFAF